MWPVATTANPFPASPLRAASIDAFNASMLECDALLLILFTTPDASFVAKGITKHNYLPKEVMGFPVEGNLVPVKDGGEVVGCVICSYSVEGKEKVREIAEKFRQSIQEIDDSVQDVIVGIEAQRKPCIPVSL